MNKLLIAVLMFASVGAIAGPVSEPIPGTGGDAYICTNKLAQIKTDGYFHYLFTSKITEGATVTVTDYAADYNTIEAKVVMAGTEGFILASDDESFVLGVNISENSGTLDHRGKKDYELDCSLSGPVMLE